MVEWNGARTSNTVEEASTSSNAKPLTIKTRATRKLREVRITSKASGDESSDGGEVRVITQRHKELGIFTASSYMWLYYAVYPAPGISIVPVGTLAGPNEAHAILDPCENYDADAVPNSNATYEFAGVDAERPGLLYSKTLPCVLPGCCRESTMVSLTHSCPFWATTGKWRQNTVQPIANVPLQQQKQRLDVRIFRLQMAECEPVATYAVYADPKNLDTGKHPYWLIETVGHPYSAPHGLKDAWFQTIRVGTWIVDIQWFQCTSEDPNHKSYKKLDGAPTHLPMKAFITEKALEWAHFSPRLGTGVLSDESHMKLMRHNFSNVRADD